MVVIFLEYEFIVVYKLQHTHVVANGLSKLPNSIEPTEVSNQIVDVTLFHMQLVWLKEVKEFL
jgi:hypothetical protein